MRWLRTFAIAFAATLLLGGVFVGGYFLGDRQSASAHVSDASVFNIVYDVQGLLKSEFLGEVPSPQTQAYGAAKGLAQSYKDPYTMFVEPAPRTLERDNLRGHFGGIGANMSRNEAGDLVLMPMRDRPAAKAGVKEGDILLKVDGKPIAQDMTIEQIIALIRGDEGSQTVLTLRRAGVADPFDVAVVRERIDVPSVEWRVLDPAQHIGYARISIMGEQTSSELQKGIAELAAQGVDKLVLDLRGNGGGLVDTAVDTASQFLRTGNVLIEQEHGGQERFYPVKRVTSPAQDWQLAVLSDGGTASAAEIISGALRDQGRAVLIGDKTYGKGSVQRVHELSDGSSLHVTIARWLTPSRHQIDKTGLQPDVQVSLSNDDRNAGRDPQLARAQAWLRGEH